MNGGWQVPLREGKLLEVQVNDIALHIIKSCDLDELKFLICEANNVVIFFSKNILQPFIIYALLEGRSEELTP